MTSTLVNGRVDPPICTLYCIGLICEYFNTLNTCGIWCTWFRYYANNATTSSKIPTTRTTTDMYGISYYYLKYIHTNKTRIDDAILNNKSAMVSTRTCPRASRKSQSIQKIIILIHENNWEKKTYQSSKRR